MQVLVTNPRVIQKSKFPGNLELDNNDDNTEMTFILEELKKTILTFSQGTF